MPSYKSWGDVPLGDQNLLNSFADQWGAETGYRFPITNAFLLEMANAGVLTQQDFGTWAVGHLSTYMAQGLKDMPWARYGLTQDSYQQLATTYTTEYKRITGQDIPADQLTKAFLSSNLAGGGLLSGSQYAQQLMNDSAIQGQYGWVKYGMDYTAWTQQKLSLQGTFGRSIKDAEAATILQYNRASQGPNLSTTAPNQSQQQAQGLAGISGSTTR